MRTAWWVGWVDRGRWIRPTGYRWTNHASPVAANRKPPKLNTARAECNVVILPTSEILVLHGDLPSATIPSSPELLSGGTWKVMNPETSIRDHHSTALLLPSGDPTDGFRGPRRKGG